MTIRSRIIEFLLNPLLSNTGRLRVIQTLEMLEHTGPFTSCKYQGDENNECAKLRKWINSNVSTAVDKDLSKCSDWWQDKEYQSWAKSCPFKKEAGNEWLSRGWFWED